MIAGYLQLAALLDRVAMGLCKALAGVLVATVLCVVVLRYGFGTGSLWLQDAAGYAFASFLILSVPVCLARDGHVRVDVISERLGPRYLRGADALAFAALLVPVFGLILWAWAPTLGYSWSIRETSVETGGLPGLFAVKTVLPVAAVLTLVQGLAAVLRADRTA